MAFDINNIDERLFGDSSPILKEIDEINVFSLVSNTNTAPNAVFDQIMANLYKHIDKEFQKNRITGSEYTKAYIAITESALSNSVQFLLNKDQSYWQAVGTQIAAINSRIQVDIALKDLELKDKDLALKEQELLNQQKQLELLEQQLDLIKEQMESQRAQTLNTRSDGAAVAGLIKSQKDLYAQQIDSYKRDAETKLGKLMIDTWTTQKTVDEGLTAPTQVSNANLDTLIAALRSRNTI